MKDFLTHLSNRFKSIYLLWVVFNFILLMLTGGILNNSRFYGGILRFNSDFFPFGDFSCYDYTEFLIYSIVPFLIYYSSWLWHEKPESDKIEKSSIPDDTHKYVEEAKIKMSLKDYNGCINSLNKIIELEPTNFKAFNNRGFVNRKLGKYKEAIQDCTKAVELDPKLAPAFYNRGVAKFKLDKKEEAIHDFSKAIKLDPMLSKAYYMRGNINHSLGNNHEAIKDLDIAIDLDPDYKLAYYDRGIVYMELGKTEKSNKDFGSAIAKWLSEANKEL